MTRKSLSGAHSRGLVIERAELESYLQDRPRRLAEHLEGDAAHRREEIERAVAVLKKDRWSLYMRLVAPYFCNDRASRGVEDRGIEERGPEDGPGRPCGRAELPA